MLDDAACDPRYQFCRFEDLLTNPVTELTSMLQHLGLDSNLSQVRLQRRRVMNEAGEHLLTGQREWEVYWLNLNELPQYLDGDVNRRQILQLSDRDRDAFLSEAEDTMERLGYCLDGSLKSMDLIAA
jgi:hypothetical protein